MGDPKDDCKKPAGVVAPVINRAKCEGKKDCVRVCPYDVFEVRRIDDEDFAKLGLLAKLPPAQRTELESQAAAVPS